MTDPAGIKLPLQAVTDLLDELRDLADAVGGPRKQLDLAVYNARNTIKISEILIAALTADAEEEVQGG